MPVLEKAAQVAATNGAKLTVLDVVEPIPPRHRTVTVKGRTVDLQTLLLDDHRQQLAGNVKSAGVDEASVKVVTGTPFIEVTRYVTANNCDMVVVGESPPTKGRNRMVAPDVTQLIRACPAPVWVMCPSAAQKLRILALVDPDPTDRVRDGLNDSVLELATSITRWQEGVLHVAHAWQLYGESKMRSMHIPPNEVDKVVKEVGEEHQRSLKQLTKRHGVDELGGRTHLIKGLPNEVLPELAESLEIDLIAMGTVARRGLSGLIMGNTAEAMLRSVRCSILTVKPEGFVSPIAESGK